MSKRLLVLIYVTAVLLFSGFVANSAPVQTSSVAVEAARIDQANGLLHITGKLSTICQTKPNINISKIDDKISVIYVEVNVNNASMVCNDIVGPGYDIVFNLKELSLKAGKEYALIFKNYTGNRMRYSYVATAQNENVPVIGFEPSPVNGTVAINKDGSYELLKNGQHMKIVSPTIQVSEFANEKVWINGYVVQVGQQETELKNGSAPVLAVVPVSISALK